MARSGYLKVIPITFLLLLSFIMGFHVQDALAANSFRSWTEALARIPAQVERLLERSQDTAPGDLPILETYWAVLERLSEDYYGQKIDERELTYNAIRGMLRALNDPFTRFLDPEEHKKMREENEGNFVGIGAQLDVNSKHQIYIKEPLPDSPAEKAGVKAGDIILKVNDEPITGMDIEDVVKKIRGEEGTKVKLTFLRKGEKKPVEITITRRVVQFRMVTFRMEDEVNKLGYIRLYQFNEQSDAQLDQALTKLENQGMRGLILDLRSNPGGLLDVAIDIGSRFIPGGPVVIIQERGGSRTPHYVKESKHNQHKTYPLVVLVDDHSASASEIVAGAIRDNKVGTLVGTRTFGKGRVQTIMPLNDGSAVAITTAKYLTPSGTDINKVGIKPDVVVEVPDDADLTDPKKDPQLLKAEEVLKEKLGIKGGPATTVQAQRSRQPVGLRPAQPVAR